MKQVRVRFAPSPTGYLHIGGLRSALYNYLFAKKHQGSFILRIEDTDKTRYVEDAQVKLEEILYILGLSYDEGPQTENALGPYIQSERLDIYKEYALRLIKDGHAYYCFCTANRLSEMREEQQRLKQPTKYDRTCLHLSKEIITEKLLAKAPHVIRLKVPDNQEIVFTDMIHGRIQINSQQIDDQVLLKSDGYPTYHLAVVVDDHLMEITHVIRGEEWISSTPKHILLYQCFGWDMPVFAHLPLILNKDKSKLSKRQNDVAVESYLDKGFLKDALLNYVALLGWNPRGDQEIYSLDELIENFDITQVNKSGAVFDITKLEWMNGCYIRQLPLEELVQKCVIYLEKEYETLPSDEILSLLIRISADRLKKIADIVPETQWFFTEIAYDAELLVWKKSNAKDAKRNLIDAFEFLSQLSQEQFQQEILQDKIFAFIKEKDRQNGDFLWPLRVALSGLSASPSPFELMEVLKKEQVMKRIQKAIDLL